MIAALLVTLATWNLLNGDQWFLFSEGVGWGDYLFFFLAVWLGLSND